jgi:hypothetical protein
MMKAMSRMGTLLSGLLVGLGVAVLARTVAEVGFDRFVLGYVVGPGLILTGLIRMRLQRMLERGEADDGDTP